MALSLLELPPVKLGEQLMGEDRREKRHEKGARECMQAEEAYGGMLGGTWACSSQYEDLSHGSCIVHT